VGWLAQAADVDGRQWTMQYIREDGSQRFAKNSRKEVCFQVVVGLDALAKAPALVIGEGNATAGSLSQTLGFATFAAIDSGNLVLVANALAREVPGQADGNCRQRRQAPQSHSGRQPQPQQGRRSREGGRRQAGREPQGLHRLQ